MSPRGVAVPLLFLWVSIALPFHAAAEETPPPAPAVLSKGDALLVRIDNMGGGLPEYREIVDIDGNIEIPFLTFLSAEGKTIAAVEAEMAEAYAQANVATTAVVHITYVTHFDPPPSRSTLIRVEDPRRPVPAPTSPPLNPEP